MVPLFDLVSGHALGLLVRAVNTCWASRKGDAILARRCEWEKKSEGMDL